MKKAEFYIAKMKDHKIGFEVVSGSIETFEVVKLSSGTNETETVSIKIGFDNRENGWTVTDIHTGLQIYSNIRTRKEAVEKFTPNFLQFILKAQEYPNNKALAEQLAALYRKEHNFRVV